MTILDAMNSGRKKFTAITTANQPDMSMRDTFQGYEIDDPGPAILNHWHCRACGLPVPSNRATCAKCKEVQSERA